MEVHFTAEMQAKLDLLADQTGRATRDMVLEAVNGYFDGLSPVRATLDGRYDDIKSGCVRLISREDFIARLQEKRTAQQ